MGFRALHLVRPFLSLLPEIEAPVYKIAFNERILWTVGSLIIFMVMSQVPLYGIESSDSSDPLYWMRAILASNRGTLTELGITPIVTSGMILQLLSGANILHVDYSLKEDRALFSGAQKLFAMAISLVLATITVLNGLYGSPNDIGTSGCLLLIAQIVIASLVIMLLDELLQKGYGFGSGINLFVGCSTAVTIFWKTLSPTTVNLGRGPEYEGALIALFSLLVNRKDKTRALLEAFYRPHLPNVMGVLSLLVVFAIVVYLQGFRIELSIKSNRMRGQRATYPIRLLYTSSMPIMLLSTMTSNILMISHMLYQRFGTNAVVQLLGVWEPLEGSNQLFAKSGVVYYLSPPRSILEAVLDPIHTLVYTVIIITVSSLLSKTWMEISGSSVRDVAHELKENQLVIVGYRDSSMYKELKRVIPVAASFGGAILGAVSVVADMTGAIGSGTGILLCVCIIYQYFEMIVREQMETGASMESMMGGRMQ
ncbi:SecY subunit domain-containing protein [Fennellomyces sp. T-0311]|nr:SecY subunit domain-containing protein [Fennellomyces sp. T-0311]